MSMTKTQCKRALHSIRQKAKRIWLHHQPYMSTADVVAIEKIIDKNLRKMNK
jgi:hypothetical protein